jgi:hypothetical protein
MDKMAKATSSYKIVGLRAYNVVLHHFETCFRSPVDSI